MPSSGKLLRARELGERRGELTRDASFLSVVDEDPDDDPTCPVCLESLSLRLQGELGFTPLIDTAGFLLRYTQARSLISSLSAGIVCVSLHSFVQRCACGGVNSSPSKDEACFEAVYGGVARARSKSGPLGVCGVCRKDMKLGEEGEGPGRKNSALLSRCLLRRL